MCTIQSDNKLVLLLIFVTSLLLNGKKGLLAKSVLWSYLHWNTDRCSCQYRIQSITMFFSSPAQAWVTGTASRHGRRCLVSFPAFSPPLHWAVSLLHVCEREWDVEESKKEVRRKSMNRHISIGAAVQWLSSFYCLKCTLKEVTITKYESDGEHLEEGQKH